MLPCMHEQTMPCADENDISEGSSPWPQCHEQSNTPYLYDVCKHTLDVTCHKLSVYNRDPMQVPKCAQMVDHMPGCGHALTVKCYLKRQYEGRLSEFVCPEKLQKSLPRCGHSKQVSYAQEITLRHWIGNRCAEQDVVREGHDYGPKDHTCTELVTFVRQCGHETKMPCELAFESAKVVAPCREKVNRTNPHCGHPCEVTCYKQRTCRP